MGRGSGKRATRKRVADVSAAARADDAKLERATTRRLAKLEKDLAAAHENVERHRSRLETASAEADRIRGEIAGLLRHASEPAVDGARKVGHAAADLLGDAADAVADAAGGVAHAAGSVVGAARRSVRAKPAAAADDPAVATAPLPKAATAKAAKPAQAKTAKPAKPATQTASSAAGSRKPATPTAPRPARPAVARSARARKVTPPATGPGDA
jgi:adenylylsulfate kinase